MKLLQQRIKHHRINNNRRFHACWVTLLILLLVLAPSKLAACCGADTGDQAPATQNDPVVPALPWRLHRQSTDFTMSYREVELAGKPVLEIRAKFVVKARLSAFFRLLRDTEQASNWLDSAQSVRTIASPSQNEDWVHTTFDTPWPLQQRDMVTCSKWQQHIDYSIEMNVLACPDKLPVPAATVRITQVKARWLLTPMTNQQYQVFYIGTADAGGGIPRWLSDQVTLASSFRSFRAMQQQLAKPEYQLPLAEICESALVDKQTALPDDSIAPVANSAACEVLKAASTQ